MIQFVRSNQVFEFNGQIFGYPSNPNGIPKSIACRSVSMGYYWLIPIVQGNRVVRYNELVAVDNVKPQPDAFKIQRLKDALDANTEYGIAVLDTDGITSNTFVDSCNGCCGDTPTMPNVSIPAPIIQSGPASTTDGVNRFVFPFPSNPFSYPIAVPYPWFNGAAGTPITAGDAVTTAAQAATWATTNWSDYGTWTSSGDALILDSASTDTVYVTKAGMQPALVPQSFCIDLSSFSIPAAVNGVKLGTGTTTLAVSPFMLSSTSGDTVINALKKYMPTATFTKSTGKVQVDTISGKPIFYYDTSVVLTAGTGACS